MRFSWPLMANSLATASVRHWSRMAASSCSLAKGMLAARRRVRRPAGSRPSRRRRRPPRPDRRSLLHSSSKASVRRRSRWVSRGSLWPAAGIVSLFGSIVSAECICGFLGDEARDRLIPFFPLFAPPWQCEQLKEGCFPVDLKCFSGCLGRSVGGIELRCWESFGGKRSRAGIVAFRSAKAARLPRSERRLSAPSREWMRDG